MRFDVGAYLCRVRGHQWITDSSKRIKEVNEDILVEPQKCRRCGATRRVPFDSEARLPSKRGDNA